MGLVQDGDPLLAAGNRADADTKTVPPLQGQAALLEAGVLAFRRAAHGTMRILLISKKRTKNWGIPKGRLSPKLSFAETAAKEAFEEAGVVGAISPSSVGVFRATKRTAQSRSDQIIEVWVYLLEVTETLGDWPEKGKRITPLGNLRGGSLQAS